MKINILEYNIDFLKMYLRLKGIIEKVLFKYINTAKKYIAIVFLVFFTNMMWFGVSNFLYLNSIGNPSPLD